jgi:hypothetical protein
MRVNAYPRTNAICAAREEVAIHKQPRKRDLCRAYAVKSGFTPPEGNRYLLRISQMIAWRPHRCQWRLVTPYPLFCIHAQGDGKEVHSSHVPLFSLPKTVGPVLIVHPLSSNHVPVRFSYCRSTFSSVLAPFPPFPSCSAARFPDGLLFRFFPIHTCWFCFVLILGLLVRTCSINEDDAYHGAAQATLQRT